MNQWKVLALNLGLEKNLLGSRNSIQKLKKLYRNGLAVIKRDQGEIIAFGGLWPTIDDNFLELGSMWVKKEFRGYKLSSLIFIELIKKIPKDKTVFCITHDEKIIHLLKKFNWQRVTKEDWENTIPFNVSCGPCDRVKDKNNCSFKGIDQYCAMFFYKN